MKRYDVEDVMQANGEDYEAQVTYMAWVSGFCGFVWGCITIIVIWALSG